MAKELPKIGDTFRYCDYKYHVVLIFEDKGDTHIVIRYYGKRKQWWHYEVWSLDFFLLLNASGTIKIQ